MLWYVKKQTEDDNNILINYSYEENKNCDGLLKYNKKSDEIIIEKMSQGADEFATKWLFQHIYRLIDKNELTQNKRIIAIG